MGIMQSLFASGRLQGVDPYAYLVDVLLRIDTHPACDVHQLTPASGSSTPPAIFCGLLSSGWNIHGTDEWLMAHLTAGWPCHTL